MELFTVNRYDETKLNEEDEKAQEALILQTLLARREKKARLRASKTPAEITTSIDNAAEHPEHTLPVEPSTEEPCNDEATDEAQDADVPDEAEEQEEPDAKDINDERDVEPPETGTAPAANVRGLKQLGDFTVLGGDKLHRLKQTEEVLPPWLSHPTIIQRDVSDKGPPIKKQSYLHDTLKDNLKTMGFKRLFPVQEAVIPWILEAHRKPAPFWPRDVCISSPTGSGKTLAFAVPVVQLLLKCVAPAVRALVILPVQELAEQVYQVFRSLCEGTNVRAVVLSRGLQLESEQNRLVKYCNGEYVPKVDIVVTTAGRLIEHLHSTKGFTLRHLRFLIVDEADKVMNQIQNDWLYHLNKHVKQESDEYLMGRTADLLTQTELFDRARQPHKLLFSATFKRDAEKLKTLKLFHPKLFTAVNDPTERTVMAQHTGQQEPRRGKFAGQYTTPVELRELVCITEQRTKPLTLYALIRENEYRRFLVFTNSINSSHRLSFVLQRLFGTDLIIEEWSSSLSPAARRGVLSRFSMGKVNGIICTDALARGIDIESIDVVISYDVPANVDTYIHRIGRTARAGSHGTAITLLLDEEKRKFNTLLREADKEELETIGINPSTEEEFAAKYTNALNDLREALGLETEVIKKIRNGNTIGNMTRVNLLTKLKDQLDIAYSTEIIKTLKHLPKSWTNEAIESKAKEHQHAGKKRKQQDDNVGERDEVAADGPSTAEDKSSEKLTNGTGKAGGKKRKLQSNGISETNGSVDALPAITEPPTVDAGGKKKKQKKRKPKIRKASSGDSGVVEISSKSDGEQKTRQRMRIKRKVPAVDGQTKKNRWRKNAHTNE
uniref:ATP-dependent RNA helicase n=1 Tax=Anopheles dirus TaxID=7168 RepID=A0A182N9A6_9DIPT